MTAFERFTVFAMAIFIAGVGLWAWAIDERTENIAAIAESADRIEAVASSSERMLSDTLEAQQTPEAIERQFAARRAVDEIHEIKMLLCELPELADHDACP